MWIEPIDRVLTILEVAVGHLSHNDVDTVLYRDLLGNPLVLGVFDLQLNNIISEIFSIANKNYVAREDITKLSCHINVMESVLINF